MPLNGGWIVRSGKRAGRCAVDEERSDDSEGRLPKATAKPTARARVGRIALPQTADECVTLL